MRAILGQQITVPAATQLAGRLVAAFGAEIDDPAARALGLTHVFPSPERLAAADVAGLGLMPGARAAALSSLAAAVAADPALLGPYRDLAGAVAQLRSLPGIGEWTAQYIALRALREPDAFPAADVGLLRAMTDASGRRPTPAELLARAESWRPWRAYAAMHLWASLAASVGPMRRVPERVRKRPEGRASCIRFRARQQAPSGTGVSRLNSRVNNELLGFTGGQDRGGGARCRAA